MSEGGEEAGRSRFGVEPESGSTEAPHPPQVICFFFECRPWNDFARPPLQRKHIIWKTESNFIRAKSPGSS